MRIIVFEVGGIDILTHDVVMQHLSIRLGGAGMAADIGWNGVVVPIASAHNLIFDHFSLNWGADENLSASGPRFTGETRDEWGRGTSFTTSLPRAWCTRRARNSSIPKGSLIHGNVSDNLIYGPIYGPSTRRLAPRHDDAEKPGCP